MEDITGECTPDDKVDAQCYDPIVETITDYIVGDEAINGPRLRLRELHVNPWSPIITTTATGGHVWPSSHVLARLLLERQETVLANVDNVLELGAGCGLPGLTAATLLPPSARVLLTDTCEGVLDILRQNVNLNAAQLQASAAVSRLHWQDFLGGSADVGLDQIDLVLGAHIFWMDEDAMVAARMVRRLLRPAGRCIIVLPRDCAGPASTFELVLQSALADRAGPHHLVDGSDDVATDSEAVGTKETADSLGVLCGSSPLFEVDRFEDEYDGTPCTILSCIRLDF